MRKLLALIALNCVFITSTSCSSHKDPFMSYRHQTASQIYYDSRHALIKKHYTKAIKGFEALDTLYPFGPYAQRSQFEIIYAYYKADQLPMAVVAADRYIRLYPQDKGVDYALYMKGIMTQSESYSWLQRKFGVDASWRDLTDQKESFNAFNQLVLLYPESRYTPDALLRMYYLRNIIARKSLLLAQFYYKQKAYVASANRAAYVVEHFNGTVAVPDALAIMVKSDRKLGENELAHNTYRILQASYPDSPAYKSVAES